MNVGSLFSGIGGLDLGLERAGMRVRWQCEIDPYCRAVLRHHWPDIPCFENISEIGNDHRHIEPVDLICGGFPCQPVSLAGKGLAQKDPRWLWPEFARVVSYLRPRYVLVENVPGLVKRGLDLVVTGLAEMGYDAEWEIVSAAACGAPHLRERIFVVAHSGSERRQQIPGSAHADEGADEGWTPLQADQSSGDGEGNRAWNVADPNCKRCPQCGVAERQEAEDGLLHPAGSCGGCSGPEGRGDPRQDEGLANPDSKIGVRSRTPGEAVFRPEAFQRLGRCGSSIGDYWTTEPNVGRVAHGVPNRLAQLRALGNAVVPQVAEAVGRMILAAQ